MKKCTDCKYHITEEYGNSNYTVEGTNISCLKNMNPKFPCDRGWDLIPEIKFAEECPTFKVGLGVCLDVEMEYGIAENYSDDPEIKRLLKNYKR